MRHPSIVETGPADDEAADDASHGERELTVQLREVVTTSGRVREASGRREKIGLLAALLRSVPPGEIEIAVAFLAGGLPQGRIGIGGAALGAAQPQPSPEPTLELREVDVAFAQIMATRGPGSGNARIAILRELLSRATRDEQEFLVHLLFGELRQGAQEGIMLEAIAHATAIPLAAIRRAVMAEGDPGIVARIAITEGEAGLVRSAVRLFNPVRPMLAQSAEDVDEAMTQLGEAALEFKLDGARVQVHRRDDEIKVYTRGLQEVTASVPEIVAAVRGLPVRELIVDGEAIALRPDGTPHPFQVSMRRFGRRADVETLRDALPLSLFLFDILHLDGTTLIDHSQADRARALMEHAPPGLIVPRRVTADLEIAREFLAGALRAGHEGIMAKSPGARYEAGSRGAAWLKLKRVETLDLVVLAAEWGSGRRRGWLSNLHLGARDRTNGSFVMLGKTFKGMTDEMLRWQTEKLLALEIGRDDYTVHVRPELVVEIAFADVQRSPRYPGGLALRFARVKRYRPEKPASEADTIDRVREIHRRSEPGTGEPAG